MDPAFLEFGRLVVDLLPLGPVLTDGDEGVRTYATGCEVETSVELDVVVGPDGRVGLGSVPPLYRESTTFRPAYHRLRVVASLTEVPDGG